MNSANAEAAVHDSTGYLCSIVPVAALATSTKMQMARLYLSYYDASSTSIFLHDLDAKDEALLVHSSGRLVGFTTLRLFAHQWNGSRIRVVYSGDTVVEREHWGQHALAFAWIEHAGDLRRAHPDFPLYWFLLVKGHRTFRYLSAFLNSFHPHWRKEDGKLKALADSLARATFAHDYNPGTGVVEFDPSRGQLKPDIARPDGAAAMREDVRFFLSRNPGYVRGHELVCLSELAAENLKPLARRIFVRPRDARERMGTVAVT